MWRLLCYGRAQKCPPHNSWLTRPSYHRPALRAVCYCVDSGAGEDKMSLIKRLKCLVVGCNNEYSSRHLLPTSKLLKTQRINVTFALKWMRRSPIYINASMFARIIRDAALSTEEVSIRIFRNCCELFPRRSRDQETLGYLSSRSYSLLRTRCASLQSSKSNYCSAQ